MNLVPKIAFLLSLVNGNRTIRMSDQNYLAQTTNMSNTIIKMCILIKELWYLILITRPHIHGHVQSISYFLLSFLYVSPSLCPAHLCLFPFLKVNLTSYTFESLCFHTLHRRLPHFSHQTLTSWYNSKAKHYRWVWFKSGQKYSVSDVIIMLCKTAMVFSALNV